MTEYFVEGWTDRIREQLLADGEPFDLTGMMVEPLLRTKTGALVTLPGTVGIESAAEGIVYYEPTGTDLLAAEAPYKVRWKITNVPDIFYFPNRNPSLWRVSAT